VFKNRVLRRIFGPTRDEVTGEWRKLHNEIRELYSLPSIIRIIKSRWAGHVARMREVIARKDQDVGGWIILGWILDRWDGVMWTGLVWLKIGTELL
jgi:hypothetical protein